MSRMPLGVTLIELLAVIAVASLVIAIGAPTYQQISLRWTASTEARSVFHLLQFARYHAIHSGENVRFCSFQLGRCHRNHEGQFAVFKDLNRNLIPEADEILMLEHSSPHVLWQKAGTAHSTGFTPEGHLIGIPTHFQICPNTHSLPPNVDPHQFARQVILSRSGRIRMALDSNNDGIVESASGDNLTCNNALSVK